MNRVSKIGYALAMAMQCLIIIALGSMVLLQILDVRQLTLKQVGTAILALMACTARIGGGENGCKKDNSRH